MLECGIEKVSIMEVLIREINLFSQLFPHDVPSDPKIC